SLLREQPLVEDITGEDNTLEVSYSGNDDDIVKLLKMLIIQDVPVTSFSKEEGSLEEVFMEVTKEYAHGNME
ncbi:MAG: DUF4162 domain-containing protein, partial [Clostridiales bacterium]|nr:DUF4162 domain-containing protein [Clostridiales bacterium]